MSSIQGLKYFLVVGVCLFGIIAPTTLDHTFLIPNPCFLGLIMICLIRSAKENIILAWGIGLTQDLIWQCDLGLNAILYMLVAFIFQCLIQRFLTASLVVRWSFLITISMIFILPGFHFFRYIDAWGLLKLIAHVLINIVCAILIFLMVGRLERQSLKLSFLYYE